MKLTCQQSDAVKARGNVLVSAAAGSGKTAVLTARVIDLILNSEAPVDIDKLLIVTFTNASAAEMSKRIADALQNAIDEDRENIRAARQKILLDSASICTIDAFCNNLVKENFSQLDIKPDYTIISGTQLMLLNEAAMNITVDSYYADDDEDFFKLIDILGDDERDSNLRDAVSKIYDFTCTLPFPDKWLDEVSRQYTEFSFDNSQWTDIILNECREMATLGLSGVNELYRDFCDNPDIGNALSVIIYSKDKYEAVIDCIDKKDWDGALSVCDSFKAPTLRFSKECDEETKEWVKAKNAECKAYIKKIKGYLYQSQKDTKDRIATVAPHIVKLVEIVKKYSDNLLKIKKDKNQFNFSDIEAFALQLLVDGTNDNLEQTDLARSICSRYRDVLVDEYQDTNDLQNAIFNAVSDNGKNLFTVGDVKQCIYNFRKANPINFLKKKNSYPIFDGKSDKSKIILSGNFRSSEKICAFVNYIFERLMVEGVAGMDYTDEDKLVPLGSFSAEDESKVSIDIIDSTDCEKNDNILQAEYIANYIKNAVGNQMISSGGVMRPVQYSDFLIMMRSLKNKTQDFVDVFAKADIPVSTEVETGYFVLPEICTIVNLLKVVNNPIKDVPMLAVALSPLYALSPDEVANIRMEYKKVSLYSAFESAKDGNDRVSFMLEKIKLYRRWAASMSVSSLISRILDDSMLTQIMLSTENGEMKKANLLYFIEYAKGYEKNSFGGLSGFISYIDLALSSKRDISRKYTVGDTNSVKIMSIHGSKGLQAPICFIVNCSNSFYLRDCSENVVLHPKHGIGIRMFDSAKRLKYTTMPRDAVALAMKKDAVSEEARLLYVAMTRAQNRLILLSVMDNARDKLQAMSAFDDSSATQIKLKSSYLDWLLGIVGNNVNLKAFENDFSQMSYDCDADFTVNVIPADKIESVICDAETETEKTVIDFNEINDRLSFSYPYEKILGINSKYSASGLAERENLELYYCTKKPSFMNDGGISASGRGTIMHQFMEKCSFSDAESDIDAEIARLVDCGVFTDKEAKCIDKSKIAAFFSSTVYGMIKNADTVLREPRFIYEMAVRDIDSSIDSDERVTVQGVADCVIIKDGKITVIDYKTDRVSEENELVARYSSQLELYAKAMNNTYDLPVDDCIIYSFALDTDISLGFSV